MKYSRNWMKRKPKFLFTWHEDGVQRRDEDGPRGSRTIWWREPPPGHATRWCDHLVHWYIQNVSTFPNTFTIVSPLICVFWIQLTQTNAVFSRIALVSCFCAEIQLLGKIPENTAKFLFYQKTHGARRWDREGLGGSLTTWWCGLGLATPGGGEATPAASSSPPFTYIYLQTWNYWGFGVFTR
jgi:hypothetical protein